MLDVAKGSKTDLSDGRYLVRTRSTQPGLVDIAAVLLNTSGKVLSDNDFVFFNNPQAPGVALTSDDSISIDLTAVPADVQRILLTASTEAQSTDFGSVPQLQIEIAGDSQHLRFAPTGLSTETVLQAVAFYRRGSGWRIDAIGQGYSQGLAALATEFGIDVDDSSAPPTPEVAEQTAPAPPSPIQQTPSISFDKVKVALTKDSPSQTARIDLRKSQGDPSWVLTVGLEWDGRGATYADDGRVTKYGTGDLDVYFFCRNEETNEYVVISGDKGHQGDLKTWPYMHHYGDSKGPGKGNKPAAEQVRVLPTRMATSSSTSIRALTTAPARWTSSENHASPSGTAALERTDCRDPTQMRSSSMSGTARTRSGRPWPTSTCRTAYSPSTARPATAGSAARRCRASTPRARGYAHPKTVREVGARRRTRD